MVIAAELETVVSKSTVSAVWCVEEAISLLNRAELEQYVGPGGDRHQAIAYARRELGGVLDLLKPFVLAVRA